MNKLTAKTRKAVAKYGFDACLKAYLMSREGEGANTISHTCAPTIRTTNQADAAINAGREISHAVVDRMRALLSCKALNPTMTYDEVVREIDKENAAA